MTITDEQKKKTLEYLFSDESEHVSENEEIIEIESPKVHLDDATLEEERLRKIHTLEAVHSSNIVLN